MSPVDRTLLAIQQFDKRLEEHEDRDTERFRAGDRRLDDMRSELKSGIDATNDKLDLVIETWRLLPQSGGQSSAVKPPVGMMGEGEWFWKIVGAMGGVVVTKEIIVAMGPVLWHFLMEAANVIAGIH